jgi:tRNA/rRNA methyltransferase
MELTQQDVRTWWGMVVRLTEGPRVNVQTRKRVKQKKSTSPAERRESQGPEE